MTKRRKTPEDDGRRRGTSPVQIPNTPFMCYFNSVFGRLDDNQTDPFRHTAALLLNTRKKIRPQCEIQDPQGSRVVEVRIGQTRVSHIFRLLTSEGHDSAHLNPPRKVTPKIHWDPIIRWSITNCVGGPLEGDFTDSEKEAMRKRISDREAHPLLVRVRNRLLMKEEWPEWGNRLIRLDEKAEREEEDRLLSYLFQQGERKSSSPGQRHFLYLLLVDEEYDPEVELEVDGIKKKYRIRKILTEYMNYAHYATHLKHFTREAGKSYAERILDSAIGAGQDLKIVERRIPSNKLDRIAENIQTGMRKDPLLEGVIRIYDQINGPENEAI